MKYKSKPAVLDKIAQSKFFHGHWENLQKAIGRILDEAHNPNGTMNNWVESCNSAEVEIQKINALGWSVRHGKTIE
jgi:hypothetical protein